MNIYFIIRVSDNVIIGTFYDIRRNVFFKK